MGKWLLFFLSCCLALEFVSPNLSAAETIVFIVNAENPSTTISVRDLSDYYYKKKRQWPSGTAVRFVDRNSDSAERKIFLNTILKRTGEDIDLYWIGQKLYAGTSAPSQETTESGVIQFVSAFKGAIGYLLGSSKLESKAVKIIPITEAKAD